MSKLFLLRYDTEGTSADEMAGFLERMVYIHRQDQIPVTLFCRGAAIENRETDFRAFCREVQDDPLFDLQDHSYSHIGLGYQDGKSVEILRADYERSFAIHEHVLGKRPVGVSICGTGGIDGPRLSGFDETPKSRAELDMLAELGIKMINTFLVGLDESSQFTSYRVLGRPDIMGFPSAYSDTSWMHRKEHGDPMSYILSQIKCRAEREQHMPLMLHDWVAWNHAPDRELSHVRTIADCARAHGYTLVTHDACYGQTALWQT
jgi:hypothetical protein